jgi:hypothetical protein
MNSHRSKKILLSDFQTCFPEVCTTCGIISTRELNFDLLPADRLQIHLIKVLFQSNLLDSHLKKGVVFNHERLIDK